MTTVRLAESPAQIAARKTQAVALAELDAGEITDKGSINQRAVLACRAELVGEIYLDPPGNRVLVALQPDQAH